MLQLFFSSSLCLDQLILRLLLLVDLVETIPLLMPCLALIFSVFIIIIFSVFMRGVVSSTPAGPDTQGLKITEEKVMPL